MLRRADELKTALLNTVSHDLRTPLASIVASADSLLHSEWRGRRRTARLPRRHRGRGAAPRPDGPPPARLSRAGGRAPHRAGWHDLGRARRRHARAARAGGRAPRRRRSAAGPAAGAHGRDRNRRGDWRPRRQRRAPHARRHHDPRLRRRGPGAVEVAIEDDGPGIAPEVLATCSSRSPTPIAAGAGGHRPRAGRRTRARRGARRRDRGREPRRRRRALPVHAPAARRPVRRPTPGARQRHGGTRHARDRRRLPRRPRAEPRA